jgi:hypothetical protein
MSDKAVAAPAKTQDLTTEQQQKVSSQVIATKFLDEVSAGLKGSDLAAGSQAQALLSGLKGDPLQKDVLNQIVSDSKDKAMLAKLGLSAGSVKKGANGDVESISFTSAAGVKAYDTNLLSIEKTGVTPTQAAKTLVAESQDTAGFNTGSITLDKDGNTPDQDKAAKDKAQADKAQAAAAAAAAATAAASTDNQYGGTGISVNGGVDYDDIQY